jgi:hypothetical protein
MLALPPRNSNNLAAIQLVTPDVVKKFIIAAVYVSATLASNAPAEDKKHIQADQDTVFIKGPSCGSPMGTASSFT